MIQEEIFDVQELAAYLKVEVTWVYKQCYLKTIPYFKAGKYTRFKRAQIDSWIRDQEVKPIEGLRTVK
jgi:excisionase family DNA binding protein